MSETCEFYATYETHADMTGDGIATCCDAGRLVRFMGGPLLPAFERHDNGAVTTRTPWSTTWHEPETDR